MTRWYRTAATFLTVFVSGTLIASPAWIVTTPYENLALNSVTLAGKGKAGAAVFPAVLELSCRAEQPLQVAVRVPESIPNWDVAPFEGPQGIGRLRRLLSVVMKGSRSVEAYFVNGWYSEDHTFTFGWQADPSFLARIPITAAHLLVKVEGAKRSQPVLETYFDLPDDASVMLEAVALCLPAKK